MIKIRFSLKQAMVLIVTMLVINGVWAQETTRWEIQNNGSIQWDVKQNESHMDHIEMSGFNISTVVRYGVEMGKLKQQVQLNFPMLRTIPNDTHASLAQEFDRNSLPQLKVNGSSIEEKPTSFTHRGILGVTSKAQNGLEIHHQFFPSTTHAAFFDKMQIKNTSASSVQIEIPEVNTDVKTEAKDGVYGVYIISVKGSKRGTFTLAPGALMDYALVYSGRKASEEDYYFSPDFELKKRQELVQNTFDNLVLESPDEVLNKAFAFAKIRAVESIYHTKGGLMHGPGGGEYYAAIWANDQAEYANPFFPFLGNDAGNESAINSFRHFARFINEDYKPIPSSIIAEGIDIWNGAGDRGDMAMIAYGAARFALANGDKATAMELWPLIEWCLEYCRRKVNAEGVVESDCDELENRFPAGEANLNTSSLYYDALLSSELLGEEIGIDKSQLDKYAAQAKAMKTAIQKYFSANIDGFETYRYYKGNRTLRAWICTPLTVGIYDRSKGTIEALFSEKLWTEDGLATESGKATFWDRATLYGLRGVFAAGETRRAMDFFSYYSKRRLLGDHVPYAVEAYPEGNQRHLSAESALYCRVITEGLWGIRPLGLKKFSLTPQLPEEWNEMALRKIMAFGEKFDLIVKRDGDKLFVKVFNDQEVFFKTRISTGTEIVVDLAKSESLLTNKETYPQLFTELQKMDSLVFDAGFNQCDLESMEKAIFEDFEFYHDQGGFNNSKAFFIKTFKENICASTDFKPIRKLVPESLEVFPLMENGELYGAIQSGEHQFFIKEPGKTMYLTSTAKFTHVWILMDGKWKLKRVLSFEHKSP